MAPLATGTQPITSKIKRLVPSNIQTNGIQSSTPSTSPLASANRLSFSTKPALNSAGSNNPGNGSPSIRSASRRRDVPNQLFGRISRKNSVGLRSGCSVEESVILMSNDPPPYIKSDEYILKKYRNNSPSLVIHLHPTHFRFDNQEGHFPYQSPMRLMIEHLRQRTIPHDLVEYFGDIPYYEDCLIVQVHDHKSIDSSQPIERDKSPEPKQMLFSVHNYSQYCTPSPYMPYQTQSPLFNKSKKVQEKSKTDNVENQDKENSNTLNPSPQKPKVLTVVLHPTPLSKFANLAVKVAETIFVDGKSNSQPETNGSTSLSIPSTPLLGPPSTPQSSMPPPAKRIKKSKVYLSSNNIYKIEAQINLATTAPLFLEPVSCGFESAALLESLAHPMYEEEPPAPKIRKRTIAEVAADEAFAAEQERYMLLLDERLSSNITAGPSGMASSGINIQSGGILFEARFERFKLIESLRSQYEENKRLEKTKTIENEKRQRLESEKNKLREDAEKRAEQERRLAALNKQAHVHAQLQAENNRNRQILADQARSDQKSNQGHQHQSQSQHPQSQNPQSQRSQSQNPQSKRSQSQNPQSQIPQSQHSESQQTQSQKSQLQHTQPQHAHPQNVVSSNTISAQPQRFQQQISHAPASSPIIRTRTPQSVSSPPVQSLNAIPMQNSTSSMGSSPRLGSVVQQNHQSIVAPTSHGMAAQRSQQSFTSTPRLSASNLAQSTPINHSASQTPRISQASPLQRHIAQVSHAAKTQAMNSQHITNNSVQAQVFQQQRLNQIMRQQQQQQAPVAQGMSGIMQAQQIFRNQQQQQQQAIPQQSMQGFSTQIAAMARQASQGVMPQGMNQNFAGATSGINGINNVNSMNGINNMTQQISLSPQQLQHLQQQQMLRQAHAQQIAAQQTGQFHHQQDVITQAAQNEIMAYAQRYYQAQKNSIASQNPNAIISDDIDRQLRVRAQNAARQHYINARRRQQLAAAQAAQQSGIPHHVDM
ncbi:putative transcription factor spt20 [Erysiphe neolycopersici]|uniref:Putative transcription factor spt20 n=1 Tax=Erysiphe neolycopersici TaxID=212602 RepID=A0A420HVI0_9PEZI|nr:putative transcription factor spt20 [Erysiphe neolycopersici]